MTTQEKYIELEKAIRHLRRAAGPMKKAGVITTIPGLQMLIEDFTELFEGDCVRLENHDSRLEKLSIDIGGIRVFALRDIPGVVANVREVIL